jgi:hypothetical protein
MREKEVRAQVSGARSALNEPGLISSCEANSANRDAVALFQFFRRLAGRDGEPSILTSLLDAEDVPNFFDDARKHRFAPEPI